jgi:hypothetical protein
VRAQSPPARGRTERGPERMGRYAHPMQRGRVTARQPALITNGGLRALSLGLSSSARTAWHHPPMPPLPPRDGGPRRKQLDLGWYLQPLTHERRASVRRAELASQALRERRPGQQVTSRARTKDTEPEQRPEPGLGPELHHEPDPEPDPAPEPEPEPEPSAAVKGGGEDAVWRAVPGRQLNAGSPDKQSAERASRIDLLALVQLFGSKQPHELAAIADTVQALAFAEGDVVCVEDEPGDCM